MIWVCMHNHQRNIKYTRMQKKHKCALSFCLGRTNCTWQTEKLLESRNKRAVLCLQGVGVESPSNQEKCKNGWCQYHMQTCVCVCKTSCCDIWFNLWPYYPCSQFAYLSVSLLQCGHRQWVKTMMDLAIFGNIFFSTNLLHYKNMSNCQSVFAVVGVQWPSTHQPKKP